MPPQPVHFEDFAPGQVYELGSYTVSEEEILEFGRRYDPQPFHTDSEAAKATPFGGLIASGWHTGSIFMRLYVDGVLAGTDSRGSTGLDELRWPAPVRPGDVLTGSVLVLEVQPSSKRPDRGTVFIENSLVNQDGVVVMTSRGRGLFGRRAPARAPAAPSS